MVMVVMMMMMMMMIVMMMVMMVVVMMVVVMVIMMMVMRGKIHGNSRRFHPKMQKRALEIQIRAPENSHRLQCKT